MPSNRTIGLVFSGAIALSAGGAIALSAGGALAQPQLELQRFDESFVGTLSRGLSLETTQSGAVGRLLVGLSLGRFTADAADVSELRVALPAADAPPRLCVNLTTLDGRYVAQSEHRAEGAFAEPPTLGLTTRYGDALSGYKGAQLLVRASRSAECGFGGDEQLAPAAGDADQDTLLVSVSIGRGRPKAWLERDDKRVGEAVSCVKDEDVARTHECALPIGGVPGGGYRLIVEARKLTGGSIKESYAIVLP